LTQRQKVAVIFIVQALSQPAEVYGAEITKTLISTTAFKIVFTQLAQETMKEISDLIGNKTIRKGSENSTDCLLNWQQLNLVYLIIIQLLPIQ
jgi:type IV secretory pathway TraG/TraD family ATPase VirD4